jgi:hypothetical protein
MRLPDAAHFERGDCGVMGQPGRKADPPVDWKMNCGDKLSQAFQIETMVFHPLQTKQRSFGARLAEPLAYRSAGQGRRVDRFRQPSST